LAAAVERQVVQEVQRRRHGNGTQLSLRLVQSRAASPSRSSEDGTTKRMQRFAVRRIGDTDGRSGAHVRITESDSRLQPDDIPSRSHDQVTHPSLEPQDNRHRRRAPGRPSASTIAQHFEFGQRVVPVATIVSACNDHLTDSPGGTSFFIDVHEPQRHAERRDAY